MMTHYNSAAQIEFQSLDCSLELCQAGADRTVKDRFCCPFPNSGSSSPTSIYERRLSKDCGKVCISKPPMLNMHCEEEGIVVNTPFKLFKHELTRKGPLSSPTNAFFTAPQDILKMKYRQRYEAETRVLDL